MRKNTHEYIFIGLMCFVEDTTFTKLKKKKKDAPGLVKHVPESLSDIIHSLTLSTGPISCHYTLP